MTAAVTEALTLFELNPQEIPQMGFPRRNNALVSGVIGVHTYEIKADTLGVDTALTDAASWLLERDTYGSYHTLCGVDTYIRLAPFIAETWGITTLNNHAMHISAAVTAAEWLSMPPAKRANVVRNMAKAAAEAAKWAYDNRKIVVPARRITKEEAEAKIPGFVAHGDADPGRRYDPGDDFDWALFLDSYRMYMADYYGIDVSKAYGEQDRDVPDVEPAPKPVSPKPIPQPEAPKTPTIEATYLPLYVDGGFGFESKVELQRALKAAGYYGGTIDGKFETLSLKAYQTFLAAAGAYHGIVDGDFGEVSKKAEQTFLTGVGTYSGLIDGDRGKLTISALQRSLNMGHIKRGVVLKTADWASPTVGRLTSRFGWRTLGGKRNWHAGDDIAPPTPGQTGVAVVAAAAGTVVAVGWNALAGHSGIGVLIDHGGGIRTYYGHLASESVSRGQRVKVGQQIGIMGTTGNSSGIHLHFGVLVNGVFQNPYLFMQARGVTLGKSGAAVIPSPIPAAPGKGRNFLPLHVDGDWGHRTITEAQRALKATGHYTGMIEEDHGLTADDGNLFWTAYQKYLRDEGFYKGLIDGDFGKMSKIAEQKWLNSIGHYNHKGHLFDGVRGPVTIKGVQGALNNRKMR